MRGRPMGAKDLKPRKNANPKKKIVVVEEPVAVDLGTFAQSVLSDPATREGIRMRAKQGTLTAQEMRALIQWATQAPPPTKRPSQWKTMFQAATPIETQMIANIARRAMGQPEQPIWVGTEPWTNEDIIYGKPEDKPEPKREENVPAVTDG